jgi:hypothetical protein
LSRYAPEEVSTDEKKQHHFLDGLDGPIEYQMLSHTFSTYSQLVDKAFLLENKRHELQEKKRKFNSQLQFSSSNRPHLTQQLWIQDCSMEQHGNSWQDCLETPKVQEHHPYIQALETHYSSSDID